MSGSPFRKMAGTAIDLIGCTRVNMKRRSMSFFGDVVTRLLLLAVLEFAPVAARREQKIARRITGN
jgi:hypothetical protein